MLFITKFQGYSSWYSLLFLPFILAITLLVSCKEKKSTIPEDLSEKKTTTAPLWKNSSSVGYEIENTFPHDSEAFTQGLEIHEGAFLESTGLVGRSSIRRVDKVSGKVTLQKNLSAPHFGEGLTELNGLVYQLTWTCQQGFIYDADSLELKQKFTYQGEGWGICNDGKYLYMSDGTHLLRVIDPKTMSVIHTLTVTWNGQAITRLNELEYIEGEIFANLWGTDQIARINPRSGTVIGLINFQKLSKEQPRKSIDHVLNGIAYDSKTQLLYITGKCWPNMYSVRLLPK